MASQESNDLVRAGTLTDMAMADLVDGFSKAVDHVLSLMRSAQGPCSAPA